MNHGAAEFLRMLARKVTSDKYSNYQEATDV